MYRAIVMFLFVFGVASKCYGETTYSKVSPSGAEDDVEKYSLLLQRVKRGEYDANDLFYGTPVIAWTIFYGSDDDLGYLLSKTGEISPYLGMDLAFMTVLADCRYAKLKIMVINGSPIDSRDLSTGNSLVHYASKHKDTRCLEYLLESGANVNVVNHMGETPLFFSVSEKASQILYEYGVNILHKDMFSIDAFQQGIVLGKDNKVYRGIIIDHMKKNTSKDRRMR